MRRSKLEQQFDVLITLSQEGPLKFTHIMHKTNINYSVLTECLDFLIKQEMVEKIITQNKKITYKIIHRGFTILRYFRAIDIMLGNPVNETHQA